MNSTQQEMYTQAVQKAWADADFKKKLVEDPVATMHEFTNGKFEVPAGKTLVVRDQTDTSTVYINIPGTAEADVELTEEQLEAVAGGAAIPYGKPYFEFPVLTTVPVPPPSDTLNI